MASARKKTPAAKLVAEPPIRNEVGDGRGYVDLPADFKATHATAGLDGYPAIDVFGSPGSRVRVWFWGRVVKLSGRAPSQGGRPGGAYGRSVYILNTVNGVERYLTHLDEVHVRIGQQVKPGTVVGTVADSAVSGKPGTSHVHLGRKS